MTQINQIAQIKNTFASVENLINELLIDSHRRTLVIDKLESACLLAVKQLCAQLENQPAA